MDIEASKIIPKEQKGCKKRATECKEQFIIDAATLKPASKRNLYMCCTDYKKALDSVPYALFFKVLKN
jgi:hypothetical protein